MYLSRIYWKSICILLFPALLTGLLPIAVGETADGLKLLFLSSAGIWLTYLSAKRKTWFWRWFTAVWWLLWWLHSSVIATTWLMFDSSVDAYFIVQAIANTTWQEALGFVALHAWNLGVLVLALLLVFVTYIYIYIYIAKGFVIRIYYLPNARNTYFIPFFMRFRLSTRH